MIILVIIIKCGSIVFQNKTEETMSEQKELPVAYKEFDYGDYTTIKLLHTNTGEVEEIALDVYLYGVVSAEMPASYDEEALRAQAIVARTYTIYKIMNGSNSCTLIKFLMKFDSVKVLIIFFYSYDLGKE